MAGPDDDMMRSQPAPTSLPFTPRLPFDPTMFLPSQSAVDREIDPSLGTPMPSRQGGYGDLATTVLGPPPQPRVTMPPAPAKAPNSDVMSLVPTIRGAAGAGARPEPPTPKESDPLMALGKPLSLIALAASLFTRRPAVAAMNAMAGAMQAQREGDQARYLNEYRVYQQQLAKWKEEDASEKAQYDQILKDRKLSLDERNAKLRTTAHRRGDALLLGGLDQNNPQGVLDTREKLGAQVSNALTDRQRIAEIKKEHAGDNGGRGITLPEAQAILKTEKKEAADKAAGIDPQHLEKYRGLTGQELIDALEQDSALPPGFADEVKAIGENRAPLPTGKWGQLKRQLAFQYNHGLRGQTYGAQASAEKNFSSGEARRAIRAINTVMSHLGRLDENIDYLGTTNFRLGNQALIAWAKQTGDPRINPVLDDIHAVAGELGRVYKGTVTEGEIDRTMHEIDIAQSPQALHAAVREFVHLVNGRLTALNEEFPEVTGRPVPGGTLASPSAKAVEDRIESGGGPQGGKQIGFTPEGKPVYQLPDGSQVVPK